MDTGMTEKNRQQVSEGLSRLLADSYVLYTKTQNFHWNVSGPEFYSLHLLFEKQYQELAEAIDEIAERVRALGFYVEGSLSGFKRAATLKEEEEVLTARDMIQRLVQGHESVIRQARKLAKVAEEEKDPATVDMLGRRLNAHEKMAWMLRSQI